MTSGMRDKSLLQKGTAQNECTVTSSYQEKGNGANSIISHPYSHFTLLVDKLLHQQRSVCDIAQVYVNNTHLE